MDIMEIEVLEDGSLKISTDKVSMPNHTNAEGLIREMVKVAGGESTRIRKTNAVYHKHENGEIHSH